MTRLEPIERTRTGAYGVVLTVDEIIGQPWENTVKRLDADRLSKANAKRTAEVWRYDHNKHGDVAPLKAWEAIDNGDMEDRIIDRLTVEGFIAQQDDRDKAIA